MLNEPAGQSNDDQSGDGAVQDPDTSDAALLEQALCDALDAHAAGLLSAPFGVDATALAHARRRALRSDIRRRLAEQQPEEQNENDT